MLERVRASLHSRGVQIAVLAASVVLCVLIVAAA
jgi:hypothetical protein